MQEVVGKKTSWGIFLSLSVPSWIELTENLLKISVSLSGKYYTTQKMKFSIKAFFSKCDQIRSFQRIWSHILKKSLIENFIFSAVLPSNKANRASKIYIFSYRKRFWKIKKQLKAKEKTKTKITAWFIHNNDSSMNHNDTYIHDSKQFQRIKSLSNSVK